MQLLLANPFLQETSFVVDVPHKGQVVLDIYDINGEPVKQVVKNVRAAGRYTVNWDETDARGHAVPAGIYYYRLSTDEFVKTRKIILMAQSCE